MVHSCRFHHSHIETKSHRVRNKFEGKLKNEWIRNLNIGYTFTIHNLHREYILPFSEDKLLVENIIRNKNREIIILIINTLFRLNSTHSLRDTFLAFRLTSTASLLFTQDRENRKSHSVIKMISRGMTVQ